MTYWRGAARAFVISPLAGQKRDAYATLARHVRDGSATSEGRIWTNAPLVLCVGAPGR